MKNNIPEWFWRLLPVLCGRQSAADFEQWLYEAENLFPENVYQGLLWLDYRKVAENPLLIMDWIRGQWSFDSWNTSELRDLLQLLQNSERIRNDVYSLDVQEWCACLPFSWDYAKDIYDYLYAVTLTNEDAEYWDWRSAADKDAYLHRLNAEQNRFLGELCFALARQTPPPPVPDIPSADFSGSLKQEKTYEKQYSRMVLAFVARIVRAAKRGRF